MPKSNKYWLLYFVCFSLKTSFKTMRPTDSGAPCCWTDKRKHCSNNTFTFICLFTSWIYWLKVGKKCVHLAKTYKHLTSEGKDKRLDRLVWIIQCQDTATVNLYFVVETVKVMIEQNLSNKYCESQLRRHKQSGVTLTWRPFGSICQLQQASYRGTKRSESCWNCWYNSL